MSQIAWVWVGAGVALVLVVAFHLIEDYFKKRREVKR